MLRATQTTANPWQRLLLCLLLTLGAWSCQADDSLYQALGARAGIAGFVEHLLVQVQDDPLIGEHFRETDLERLHRLLTDQICELSGGPCTYQGDSMQEAHTGQNLNSAHFNALVAQLILAMEAKGIATGAQNRLLKILAALRPEVIGH